jgi:hypothetical protein
MSAVSKILVSAYGALRTNKISKRRLHAAVSFLCANYTATPDLRFFRLNAVVIIIINWTLRATTDPVVKERTLVLCVNAGVRQLAV